MNWQKILNQHKIEMLELKEDVTINKRSFQKFKLYYSRAAKHKAYQCYFDKQTIFKDSLFYDISACLTCFSTKF
jgi:hypothetical protein